MAKYLDLTGLSYFWQKIKALLGNKVDKETGKGLSSNDYTTEEKNKLAGLNNYTLPKASDSVLGGVKVGAGLAIDGNGTLSATGGGTADAVEWDNVLNKPSTFTPSAHTHEIANVNGLQNALDGKAAKSEIPTNNNQLSNGAGYQTAAQVTALINSAVGEITGISFEIVSQLPQTGTAGKFYLMSNGGSANNIYDEYIYYNGKWEKIGTTEVDLSGYLKKTDMTAIATSEIDEILAA